MSQVRKAGNDISCVECGSTRMWKDGLRATKSGVIQRYLCRDCGFRFSASSLGSREKTHLIQNNLNTLKKIHFSRIRIGADRPKAKNLERQQPQNDKPKREATADIKGKIVEFLWYLKKKGYASCTIRTRMNLIRRLVVLGANIFNPESVKQILAEQPWSPNSKFQAVIAYDNLAEMLGINWTPPHYRRVENLPFVPVETEIDQLIAGVGRKLATFLQLIKETGVRFSDALSLNWTDLEPESQTVKISPMKGSHPRILRLSRELLIMLNRIPNNSNRIFGNISASGLRTNLWTSRKRVAYKLSNPRINKITFHSLRHWKATVEYHRVRDILHVKKILGHRSIHNTMKYIDLEHAIFNTQGSDQFVVKVAETVEDACELVEAGFEFVTELDHKQLFRKRK